MNIRQFIPPILVVIYRKLTAKQKGKYKIGKYEIEIPPNYALPNYQKHIKLYDRFLPVLAKHLSSHKLIIDVGANIGDTAIAILQQCENPIICIEPSEVFFPYLEENIKNLTPTDLKRMKTINKFVGTGLLSGELNHSFWGTATVNVVEDHNEITHIGLDILIADSSDVILLKVDTDGFDFDVIKSAKKILADSEPILFWENQMSEDFQCNGFKELYALLTKQGYKYIYIFDNFGNLITEEADFKTLENINAYIYSMDKYGCTRSFNYTDILAATEKNYLIVKGAINEYKLNWITNNNDARVS